MARTVAGLPKGSRITDWVSLGVLAEWVPVEAVHRVLQETGRQSQRQRHLPAHVVVYYVMALALYMEVSYGEVFRCLLEGLEWLGLPVRRIRQTGRSSISQARSRLGAEPVKRLYEELVRPVATAQTKGARYQQWALVSLDGSTLDLADTAENEAAFGRPVAARGQSAFPQLRFVSLVENGTHVLFGARLGGYAIAETTLAEEVLARLSPGMLCLADRGYFGYDLWQQAVSTKADLLWRIRKNFALLPTQRLSDGSYLSKVYPSKDRQRDRKGIVVRGWSTGSRGSRALSPSIVWSPRCSMSAPRRLRSSPPSTTSAGRSKMPSTSSKRTSEAARSSCAARLPRWSSRSFMACCWPTMRCGVSCMGRR